MNERQRDLFMWIWSRRRQIGQAQAGLRGLIIGVLGGLLFTFIMMGEIGVDRGTYTGVSAILPLIQRGGMLLVLSVGAFAFIGFMGANRVFLAQEAQYQALLQAGARVPDQKPEMQLSDRGPALTVGIAVAVIAAFIVALFVMYW